MQVSEIEIHVGNTDFKCRHIRKLEARVEAANNFARTPTMEEANDKLRQMAAKIGANAIINVTYKNGMSMTSWRGITATGDAVVRETDQYACPSCAESVKRAAKICRHCGAGLEPQEEATSSTPIVTPAYEIPMRESNNSTVPYWIATGVIALMILIAIIGASN